MRVKKNYDKQPNNAVYYRERRATKHAKGECHSCPRPCLPDNKHCAHCVMHRRVQSIKKLYNLAWDQYQEMVEFKAGGCWICGRVPKPGQHRLAVDHNHKTHVIRGLLCWRCNMGIGTFRDNDETMLNAAQYMTSNWSEKGWMTPVK